MKAEAAAHIAVELTAVVVAVTADQPRVLTLRAEGGADALPSGPFQPGHRTLEQGLRAWVEQQTGQSLGYVEQLYTFGDRDRRVSGGEGARVLSIGYLALVREPRSARSSESSWQDWYRYFPWEDWRKGPPQALGAIEAGLTAWVAAAATDAERRARGERVAVTFGLAGGAWSEERALERYELLYEAGLVQEAARDRGEPAPAVGAGLAMAGDHRRIVATAIARLRGKIKYRPVVFELMPPAFTLLQLQRAVETLAGMPVHKPNFRRLVEQQGLVEETGAVTLDTGGRPARLVRFRREVLRERAAAGVRVRGRTRSV